MKTFRQIFVQIHIIHIGKTISADHNTAIQTVDSVNYLSTTVTNHIYIITIFNKKFSRESWQPFQIPEEALKKAEHIAGEVTKALTGAGLWGVEFFLSKQGEVIFSELSPRPHDTGMVTLGHTTNLSEFELHFRAVMGLPIAEIHLEHIGCSAVILSPEESTEPLNYNMLDALKEDHTRIRIFGKPEAHVGRRMGVVLCYGEKGDDLNQLRDKAKRLAKTVLGTDPYMKK